jgi:hypothetical protein
MNQRLFHTLLINKLKIFDTIFYLSIIFIFIFIFIFNENANSINITDKQQSYDSVFEDDITPFCLNAYEYEDYSNFSDIEFIQINFENQQDWYENFYEAIISDSLNIQDKYKKRFNAKLIVNFKEIEPNCIFNARIRISGDWRDHLNEVKSLASMDVSLSNGNILGITKFKLFLKNTRGYANGQNEVFVSTFLDSLGYLAPRTSLMEVNLNGKSNDTFIFQEKKVKELIEFQKFRESAIIETNEEFFWDFENGSAFDSKYVLLFGKLVNFSWASKSLNNLEIATEALQKYNLSILTSSNPKTSLNYNYLGDNQAYFYNYDLINFAIGAKHGITNHNRSFYFNKIDNTFMPIYYDGNSDFLLFPELNIRDDYSDIENLKLYAPELIQIINTLDIDLLEQNLRNNNYLTNRADINQHIIDITKNINQIFEVKDKSLENISRNYLNSTINYGVKLIFLDFIYEEIQTCNQYIKECEIVEIEFNLENITELLNKENHHLFGNQPSDFEKYVNPKLNKNKLVIDDYVEIIQIGNPDVKIQNNQININISSINDKVLIKSVNNKVQKFVNWNVVATSSNQNFSAIRQDSNLLTGCVTFHNLDFKNVSISSEGMKCEDAINIISSIGVVESIDIKDSMFDGLDIDFSEIIIKNLNVTNSDNDCADFSSGSYIIEIAILNNCRDKGISIGEKSSVVASDVNVKNSFIGIAVKDSSIVTVEIFNPSEVEYCAAVYRKKQEFAGSILNIDNFNCDGFNHSFIQEGSVLNVRN